VKKYLYFGFIFLCGFTSCKNTIDSTNYYFDEPQPVNDSELKSFPSKFRGIYAEDDDTTLYISDNNITKQYLVKTVIAESELDSIKEKHTFENGKLTIKTQIYDVVKKNDSLYLSAIITDTIFKLSPTEKIKRINGFIVLSAKDSLYWKTSALYIRTIMAS
jgi:hypothetical protein